jgi:hypothetical protein
LKVLAPTCGTRKIAEVLGRVDLHLGATTVRRMLREPPRKKPNTERPTSTRAVTAKKPNSVWHVDLTTVPTSGGFCVSLLPFAFLQCWPFCWWVAVAVDHYSRRSMGFAVFKNQPSAAQVMRFLDRTFKKTGRRPRHLITDQGRQFTAAAFQAWCHRRGISQRGGRSVSAASTSEGALSRQLPSSCCSHTEPSPAFRSASFRVGLRSIPALFTTKCCPSLPGWNRRHISSSVE